MCSTPFSSRTSKAKYCTPLCASRGYNAQRKADGRIAQQVKDSAAQRANYMATWREQQRKVTACIVCGTEVERGHHTSYRRTACSGRCKQYLNHGTWPSTPVPDRHPSRSTQLPDQHAARKATCVRCNSTYFAQRQGQRYCTLVCKQRAHSSRRDACKRGQFVANVSPEQIYERDGWRCKLCTKKLKRDVVVPHPLAPTVDHIIPLAQGGTHEPVNAQAAHFLCNSRKGDRLTGDQLALIG